MKRRITWFALTLILAMAMIGSSAFAAIPVTENENNNIDPTTQGANGRMAQSTNTAELKLDKTFEKFGTTWPKKDSFEYIIEAINSWDNSNASTAQNGTVGDRDKMPAPYIESVQDKLPSAGEYKWKATVGLGAEDGNGTTGADQAGKDSNVNSAKIGNQIVKFDFTRPGYYIYKVTEVDDHVAGVTYDKHVYYIAFYVANRTKDNEQNGATLGGDVNEDGSKLYVHTITAWRSQALGGTNEQIFEQTVIPKNVDPSFKTSNQYYLLVKKGEESKAGVEEKDRKSGKKFAATMNADGTTAAPLPKDANDECTATPMTDEAFAALADGTAYWLEVSQELVDQAVARGEIGKVDRSRCKEEGEEGFVGPNKLQINFWNETDNKDITVEKKVTGTLGDLQKEFEFTVELTGVEASADYEVIPTGTSLANTKVSGLKTKNNKYYVDVATGATTATFKVVLKANESIKISGLPKNATYKVTEAASDHKASYAITSTNNATDDTKAIIKKASDANTGNGKALSTDTETVDATDGGITITYTNHRDFETETGIPGFVFPIVLIGIIALIGLAVVRRRSNVATVNDFEF